MLYRGTIGALMLLFTIVLTLVTATFCKNILANQCSSELAAITYGPGYEYKDYLISISKQLKNIASTYNTPAGQSLVQALAIKYNIAILLIDALGNIEVVDPVQVQYVNSNNRFNVYSNHDARSVMNLGAYQNELLFITYAFMSFSRDGVVLQVTLAKPTLF